MSLVPLKVSSKAAQVPGQRGRCTLTSHTPVHVPQCMCLWSLIRSPILCCLQASVWFVSPNEGWVGGLIKEKMRRAVFAEIKASHGRTCDSSRG